MKRIRQYERNNKKHGDLYLFIKQCYHINWSVEKIQKVET